MPALVAALSLEAERSAGKKHIVVPCRIKGMGTRSSAIGNGNVFGWGTSGTRKLCILRADTALRLSIGIVKLG